MPVERRSRWSVWSALAVASVLPVCGLGQEPAPPGQAAGQDTPRLHRHSPADAGANQAQDGAQTEAPAQAASPAAGTPLPASPVAGTPLPVAPAAAQDAPGAVGGLVHGSIASGPTPLPGVAVTATNTLTGTKYTTTTGLDGGFKLKIPEDGRYVLRTDFAAFAGNTSEVRFGGAKGGPRDVTQNLSLTLLSRVAAQAEDRGALGVAPGARPGGFGGGGRRGNGGQGGGAQLLGLLSSAGGAVDAGGGGGPLGAALPGLTGNSDFATDSVAVQGQTNGNGLAGIDFNQVRERAESDASLNSASGNGSTSGGSAFGGGPGGPGGGGGGFGGGGLGGGLRPSFFRHFNPNQPHGAFFWAGSNGAINARDFALRGQPIVQPNYGSNRFGLVYAGTPYIPKVLEHDKRDFLFGTISRQLSSSPFDQYGTVPTPAERTGDFSQLTTGNGTLVPIYDPTTGRPFANNVIPATRISPQARGLLNYLPLANLPGTARNYQLLTSAQTNTTVASVRLIHTLGDTGGGSPLVGLIRQFAGGPSKGLQQNFHVNFNYSHSASDNLNIYPGLGGKTQVSSREAEIGYTLSKNRLTNNFNLNWNRVTTNVTNDFTNGQDVANGLGINIFGAQAANPLNYGLPNVTLTQFTGFAEQQPSFQVNQTIGVSESSSWSHGKQTLKWGGDYKRVQLNLLGAPQLISTGSFIFSGLLTQQPGASALSGVGNTTQNGLAQSGSSLADLLLGLPQQSQLQATNQKSYLRQNVYEGYFQEDWKALSSLSLQAGVRYEYFSPYTEINNRLATLDPGNNFASIATVTPNTVGPYTGFYPRSLINPERNNVSPRLGFAWRAAKNTVVRGGYGINYANGQYSKFVQQFAFQPPFADVQTNEVTGGAPITLANGFGASQAEGNYAVDKNYRLPYVQVWNLNVQRTLPQSIVLNVGYSGSKGTRLSIVDAPGRSANASLSGIIYDYEQSVAFSNYNALTVSLRRRLAKGLALQATYTYAHSIDNATSIGGVGNAVAQNWQDLLAEESNSSFDIRNKVTGNFLYELPFGSDKSYFTRGGMGKLLEGLSLSGTYTISSGEPLTPAYVASVNDVARGSAGSQRPDRVAGAPITAGGGTALNWFNTGAFAAPAGVYGTASRFSIPGPGTIAVNESASKTVNFGETRSLEMRVTADNVFNTIQYSSVNTQLGSNAYRQVQGTAATRQFNFLARFRY